MEIFSRGREPKSFIKRLGIHGTFEVGGNFVLHATVGGPIAIAVKLHHDVRGADVWL